MSLPGLVGALSQAIRGAGSLRAIPSAVAGGVGSFAVDQTAKRIRSALETPPRPTSRRRLNPRSTPTMARGRMHPRLARRRLGRFVRAYTSSRASRSRAFGMPRSTRSFYRGRNPVGGRRRSYKSYGYGHTKRFAKRRRLNTGRAGHKSLAFVRPSGPLVPRKSLNITSLRMLRPRGMRIMLPMICDGITFCNASTFPAVPSPPVWGAPVWFGNPRQVPASGGVGYANHNYTMDTFLPNPLAANSNAIAGNVRAERFSEYGGAICLGVEYKLDILSSSNLDLKSAGSPVVGQVEVAPACHVGVVAAASTQGISGDSRIQNLTADDFRPPFQDAQVYRNSIVVDSPNQMSQARGGVAHLRGRIDFRSLTNLPSKSRITNAGIETATKTYHELVGSAPTMPLLSGSTTWAPPKFAFFCLPASLTVSNTKLSYKLTLKYDMFFFDRKNF